MRSCSTVRSTFVAVIASVLATGVVSPHAQEARIDSGGESYVSRDLVLPLGKAAIVELPRAATDILIADPELVEAVIRTPRRVYILGRNAGQTNAFFFDARNRQILNLEIRVEPDVDSVDELIQRLMPDARVAVESLNGSVILHGTVDTPVEAQRAEDLAARLAGGDQVVNMISVREPYQVLLKVRIVEMQRRLVRQLGVDLGGVARLDGAAVNFAVQNSFAIAGSALGGINGTVQTRGFDTIQNLDFAFDIFEQNGLVKTLAEPNIVAISGHQGDFFAGGTFPVPESNAQGTPSVRFEEFGVKLAFTPNVYSKGRIHMQLATEVSELSSTNGLSIGASQVLNDQGEIVNLEGFVVPGTQTRSASTSVELPSGGSIALAGLLQENITDFIDGVPGLKETPMLGALFRSQDFRTNQTELVIIATPFLVEATEQAALTDPAYGHVQPTALQSALLGKLEVAYGIKGGGTEEARLQGPLGFILD